MCIIDLIIDRQSYSDVSTKGPCLDAMFLNYLQSIGMQKQIAVIGERLLKFFGQPKILTKLMVDLSSEIHCYGVLRVVANRCNLINSVWWSI